jgi:hypothetical protein
MGEEIMTERNKDGTLKTTFNGPSIRFSIDAKGAAELNAANHQGHNDWRVPTAEDERSFAALVVRRNAANKDTGALKGTNDTPSAGEGNMLTLARARALGLLKVPSPKR